MQKMALEGIKVVDFSHYTAGPLAMAYLGDYGAEVIRVESNVGIDSQRTSPPFKDNIPGLNRSGNFAFVNRNKLGITLNLKKSEGVEVAKKLVSWADVVTESFIPGRMAQWGLGYEELKKVKPEIIIINSYNLHGLILDLSV